MDKIEVLTSQIDTWKNSTPSLPILVDRINRWILSSLEIKLEDIIYKYILEFFQEIKKHLKWQDDIIFDVLKCIIGQILWWKNKEKWALWCALFAWPTWVWKTELWTLLWKLLLKLDEPKDCVTVIDWNDYQLHHEWIALIWAPVTYVWFWEEPVLADTNIHRPYKEAKKNGTLHDLIKELTNFSIVIVDEFDKMHPDAQKRFMWALSEWRVQLKTWKEKNRKLNYSSITDLKNTLFIIITNQWYNKISEEMFSTKVLWFWHKSNKKSKQEIKRTALEELEKHLPDELLGRIWWNIFVFNYLDAEICLDIIQGILAKYNENIKRDYPYISVSFSKKVESDILNKWFDKRYWARRTYAYINEKYLSLLNCLIESELSSWLTVNIKLTVDIKDWEVIVNIDRDMDSSNNVFLTEENEEADEINEVNIHYIDSNFFSCMIEIRNILMKYEKILCEWNTWTRKCKNLEDRLKSMWFDEKDIKSLENMDFDEIYTFLGQIDDYKLLFNDSCKSNGSIYTIEECKNSFDWLLNILEAIHNLYWSYMIKSNKPSQYVEIINSIEEYLKWVWISDDEIKCVVSKAIFDLYSNLTKWIDDYEWICFSKTEFKNTFNWLEFIAIDKLIKNKLKALWDWNFWEIIYNIYISICKLINTKLLSKQQATTIFHMIKKKAS